MKKGWLLITILAALLFVPAVTAVEYVDAAKGISQGQSSSNNPPVIANVISQSQSSNQNSG